MKKVLAIVVMLFALSFQADAQKSFEKGNVLLNPGFGVGSNYGFGRGFGVGRGFAPSVIFSADFGVHDYVSVGPYVGATFFSGGTLLDFGARGNFHWWQLLDDKVSADLKQNQLDIYATLFLGGDIFVGTFTGGGRFNGGFSQGIRWYPNANKRFALNAEFGYSPISYATIGATIKIGK